LRGTKGLSFWVASSSASCTSSIFLGVFLRVAKENSFFSHSKPSQSSSYGSISLRLILYPSKNNTHPRPARCLPAPSRSIIIRWVYRLINLRWRAVPLRCEGRCWIYVAVGLCRSDGAGGGGFDVLEEDGAGRSGADRPK
jgi:hypothetical protein